MKTFLCLILLAGLVACLSRPVAARDLDTSSVSKLLIKIASEREKIVQYRFECTLSAEPDLEFYPDGMKYVVEYSKLDDHYLVLYDYSGCDAIDVKPNRWYGVSGKYRITGTQGNVSYLGAKDERDKGKRLTPGFDVMGLGFGFLGDMKLNTRASRLIANHKSCIDRGDCKVEDGEEGIKRFFSTRLTGVGRPEIFFDSKRGYWPTESNLDYAEWRLRIKEQAGGKYLPVGFEMVGWESSTLTFKKDRPNDQVQRLSGTIRWLDVNTAFSVGREAAARIAESQGVEFSAAPDSKLFR